MTQYRIRHGFSIRIDERNVHQGGDVIDLDEGTAASHIHKLEIYSADQAAADQAAADQAAADQAAADQAATDQAAADQAANGNTTERKNK